VDVGARVRAVHEHVAPGWHVRQVDVLAVEPRVVAVGKADGGPSVHVRRARLIEVAEAPEDRPGCAARDPARSYAVPVADAEAALAIADDEGAVTAAQLIALEVDQMPVGVIRGRVVAPPADLRVCPERPVGEPDPLVGAHRAGPSPAPVDDERAEPDVVGGRGEPQQESPPGAAQLEIPWRLLVEVGQKLERPPVRTGGWMCGKLDRGDERRCSTGGRSSDDLLDAGAVADEDDALAVARERRRGVDRRVRGDLHDGAATEIEDPDVGGAGLVRHVGEPSAVGRPRRARLGRRRARQSLRPPGTGSDDEEVTTGRERDALSSRGPGRFGTSRQRPALDPVGPQQDDRAVALDCEPASVRVPGRRRFVELCCGQAAAVRSVCVGDEHVRRATGAGGEVRKPAPVRRPRGVGRGREDEPRPTPSGDVDAAAHDLRLGEGERRPGDR
jgi:hypothetical protein